MESKKVLSFGGGLQTTALAVLVEQGKLKIDLAVFADTGAEKPETYYYIENYIKPIFENARVPFEIIAGSYQEKNLEQYCLAKKITPMLRWRWCTDKFKIRPLTRHIGPNTLTMIGFSADELNRVDKSKNKDSKLFPLVELGMTTTDCVRVIQEAGLPVPLRSSCFFCPFQHWPEWNYLKTKHPDLFKRAVELEINSYKRYPDIAQGLYGGKALWRFAKGEQAEFGFPDEYSCWSGHCGH